MSHLSTMKRFVVNGRVCN